MKEIISLCHAAFFGDFRSNLDEVANFESFVFSHVTFESLRQLNMMTNVFLKSGNPVVA